MTEKESILKRLIVTDTQRSITVFTTIFGALILAYATAKSAPDLYLMYAVFMGYGGGLTVSKGVVDLKRDKLEKGGE